MSGEYIQGGVGGNQAQRYVRASYEGPYMACQ